MKRTIVIEGTKENMAKLEAMLTICDLKIVETEAKTTKAEPKAEAKKTEYELPYTIEGTKVYIKTESGAFVPTKVFNAVKAVLKNQGAKYQKDDKSWKFNKKADVTAFEKAWKDGKK